MITGLWIAGILQRLGIVQGKDPLVARNAVRLAIVGTAIGLAGALTLARLMQSTLYGVHTIDIGSLSAVAVLLLGVAVFACWVPARRSAGFDPMRVLRQE